MSEDVIAGFIMLWAFITFVIVIGPGDYPLSDSQTKWWFRWIFFWPIMLPIAIVYGILELLWWLVTPPYFDKD